MKQACRAFAELMIVGASVLMLTDATCAQAQELVLGLDGTSEYEIVLPTSSPDATVADALRQTARLMQTVFKSNGIELPVVSEDERTKDKPGIFLGNTAFALANGVDTSRLRNWNYILKAIGPHVIIAGRDEPPPGGGGDLNINSFYRLGSLKATIDFLREHAGTYFLYPDLNDLPSRNNNQVREWKLTGSAAIEYKPMPLIQVPSDLDVHRKFFIGYQKRSLKTALLYDLANNFLPPVSDAALHHTYEMAVPPKKYGETHPEYFIFDGTKRVSDGIQYCISNPGFQDTLFRWYDSVLDAGFETIHIMQSDGFRPCQCEPCRELYGVDDWGEKLWIFHRKVGEHLQKSHPGKKLIIHAYGPAATPPTSFNSFPDNVSLYTAGTELTSFDRFSHLDIPGGFYAGIHNWIPNMASRYTPTRTPRFVEKQVNVFYQHNVQGVSWDGRCYVYGLEGPVVYVYGRMFENPENLQAKDLMYEFCGAAFGKAGSDMLRFYDRLYHEIEPYAQFLGTECPAWTYTDIYGRGHKMIRDPFRMLGFLYTPGFLAELEKVLERAEKKAAADKVKARLALVRREFEYLKALAKVVHLHQAYSMCPDKLMRDRVLDAIDDRNTLIESWYGYIASRDKGKSRYDRSVPMPGWDLTLFPPPYGHGANHLQLNFNSYGNPFKDTPLNWDTAVMRKAPLPDSKQMNVPLVEGPVDIDSPLWEKVAGHELQAPPGKPASPRPATVQALCDSHALYVRMRVQLPPGQAAFSSLGEDGALENTESVVAYLAPLPGEDLYYRLATGPHPESRFDAINRVVANPLDPAYRADDASWDGKWQTEIRVETAKIRWTALLIIPLDTLGVTAPRPDDVWRANFGSVQPVEGRGVSKLFWSASGAIEDVGNQDALGSLVFVDASKAGEDAIHPSAKWRQRYYEQTFEIPEGWRNVPNPLPDPLDAWLFRADELERGVPENWCAIDLDESDWRPVRVPSFWKESGPDTQGIGWYRIRFKVPADWKGNKTLQLRFAGVDEQAWVYMNGKRVREHTVESENTTINALWESPFTADVPPDLVNYGGENVMAVRVRNDLGAGGLWRPVLVCAVETE